MTRFLKTPAGDVPVSNRMSEFLENLPKKPAIVRDAKNGYVSNGYKYDWSFENGILKTVVTKVY